MYDNTRSTTYSASAASQARLSGSMPSYNPHILVETDNDDGKVLKRQFRNDAEPPKGKRTAQPPSGAGGADCVLGDGLDNDASTEDADDEDEDADDEDDGETAVNGPLGVGSNKSSALNNNLLMVPGAHDHRAGRNINALKRSLSASLPHANFSPADLERARASSAVLESDNDNENSDTYPRSNLQRSYSNSSAIRRATEAKDDSDDNEYDIDVEDIEDLDDVGDLSDDDIEKEEEMAIMEELMSSEDSTPVGANSTFATMSDLGLDVNGDLFSESDFDYDLPTDSGGVIWSDRNLSQLLDFPSMPSSPITQPKTPPASPTSYGLAHQVVQESFDIPTESESEDSDIEDIDLMDSIVEQPPRRRVTWEDSEDSEEAEVWDAFFAPSTDSEDEEDEDENHEPETGAEADMESEGDTTEEEEDLPMPTPKGKSIICRASDLPIPKNAPARYGRHCSPRPVAGNFLADGSRPICIINGTNKTYIVPTSKPIEDDDSEVEMTFGLDHGYIQDSDIWEVTMELHDTDPTFGGMTGGDGGFMNGAQIMGPPEAFMNMDVVDDAKFMEVLDEYMSDGTPDEDDSDGADILRLDDLLDISDSDAEMSDNSATTMRRNSVSETQSQYQPDNEAEAMLSRWDQVSVTAFRKRQMAHQQRLYQGGRSSPTQRVKKLVGPDTTMTPIRKRRLKKRTVSATGPVKKKIRRDEDASFYDAIF